MPAPSVKGYMPLCVTPRSSVCDEQGVGQWPMWKRYDNIRGIVDQYVDEPYKDFLALPFHEIDKLKAEELFYWYTPRCDVSYTRLSLMGDDHDYYKEIFEKTLAQYQSAVEKLKSNGKTNEANFLQLSLKYAGESDDNIYCGDGRVVVTVWGMRPRHGQRIGDSKLYAELVPEVEIHTVRFELGDLGQTDKPTVLKKRHGIRIFPHQIPSVSPKEGYEHIGWDSNPVDAEVNGDIVFTARYREIPKEEIVGKVDADKDDTNKNQKQRADEDVTKHHVRFFSPDSLIIKELDINHGEKIQPGDVPQLPLYEGVRCPSWDGDPLNDVIGAAHDYKAILPDVPEKQTHIVRFIAPDGKVISQAQVEHGTILSSALIPPLPVVSGKVCPEWDGNPMGFVVNSDHDFIAKKPTTTVDVEEERKLHTVRFLYSDGGEMSRSLVPHGEHLQPNQIPEIPIANGKQIGKWSPNPAKHVIKHDTDFVIRPGRTWNWHWMKGGSAGKGFWKWLLYIVLFLLLIFLVLYIMYRCNPCSR